MAFTHGLMTYASNAAEPAFEFFQDLIAAGWRVRGSGNYTSYENYGDTAGTTGTGAGGQYDLITSATALIQKVLNTGTSWIRFATPADAPHYREFLFYTQFRGSVVNTDWRFEWARNGATFTTGAAAGTPPTATNAIAMGSRQPVRQNSANDCSVYAAPAGENWYAWSIGDIDENYDFMFWSWKAKSNTPSLYSMFGSTYVTTPFPGNPPDVDPYLYWNVMRTSDGTPAYTDVTALYEASHSLATRQESTTSATIAPGVFASFRLDDLADENYFGTFRVGIAPSAAMVSGTVTHTNTFNFPASAATGYRNTDMNYEFPVDYGYAWVEGFNAFTSNTSTVFRFMKGYTKSNLVKIGHRATSNAQPYLLAPGSGSQWYANFQGVCLAWEALKGLPV